MQGAEEQRKLPMHRNQTFLHREYKIAELARRVVINPQQLIENISHEA